jgi:hypothetical protein
MATTRAEVTPSGTVTKWRTISPRRIFPITEAMEAPLSNSYSPARSREPAPVSRAAILNSVAERIAPASSSSPAMAETPEPRSITTVVCSPFSALGPAPRYPHKPQSRTPRTASEATANRLAAANSPRRPPRLAFAVTTGG